MKKIYLPLLLLIFIVHCCPAQFYIVETGDDYANITDKANNTIRNVSPGTIVANAMPNFKEADDDKHVFVTYTQEDKVYAGNIHRSQLYDIADFQPMTRLDNDNGTISFAVSGQVCINIQGCSQSDKRFRLDYIAFDSIKIRMDEEIIAIPPEAYEDLWALDPYQSSAYLDEENKTFYLIMAGDEEGDAYQMMWVVHDGKYLGRHMCRTVSYYDQLCRQNEVSEKEFYKYYLKETAFLSQTSVKLFENNQDIKYMTIGAGFYKDDKWVPFNMDGIFFTKDKKLINNIADLIITTNKGFYTDYDNDLYALITVFNAKKEILGRKKTYLKRILKYPEIDKKYMLNKTDSTILTRDLIKTFFVEKPYVSQDSLTRTELKKQIHKKKQLVFSIIGYLNRGIYPLEKNLYLDYTGTFQIEYDFYEFAGEYEDEKVENEMRALIAEKVPVTDYDMQLTGRSSVQRDKNDKEYFTWRFIVYSNKDFYDKIKLMEGIRISYGYDWAEYKYNIGIIDL